MVGDVEHPKIIEGPARLSTSTIKVAKCAVSRSAPDNQCSRMEKMQLDKADFRSLMNH